MNIKIMYINWVHEQPVFFLNLTYFFFAVVIFTLKFILLLKINFKNKHVLATYYVRSL
jgi:hypothetical protein